METDPFTVFSLLHFSIQTENIIKKSRGGLDPGKGMEHEGSRE
jgi:hypothetical protein